MKDLIKFSNEQFGKIRALLIDGEPWFVGKDIARALGYKNPRKTLIDHVDDEDKKAGVTIRDVSSNGVSQNRDVTLINESGMYSLILSSKLPSAKKFKRWVTGEVLPSIRKTGSYSVDRSERWFQTRQGTKTSHRPFTAAIKITIDYLNQRGEAKPEPFYYGHWTNLIQNACGIIKGQRDFSDVHALNRCDQCQTMIANLLLNLVANRQISSCAEVDAAILLHLNKFNNLLGGQIYLD